MPGSSSSAVVIVGAGPTGLSLAAELALAGVEAAVLERRPDQELAGSRAGGLHARTLEVFDQRGVAERFLSRGQVMAATGFAWIPLDLSDFPSRHPYVLGLWQNVIEHVLATWVHELGVRVRYGVEVAGFEQDDAHVRVRLSDGSSLAASYLVGCDGGRSGIRKAAGIDFPGWDATTSNLIAEVELAEEPEWGTRRDALGVHGIGRVEYEIREGRVVYKDSGPVRVMVSERQVGAGGEPTLKDLSEAMVAVYGTDYGVHTPTWISRFTDMARQAASYRAGQVLLAGDAAHVHGPVGGQGLNIGVQDAMNLGWKLAQVVKGTSPESLLDSYHAERHPVAANVLRSTLAQVALLRSDDRTAALRELVTDLLRMDEPRRRLAGALSGLDVHYDLGEGHPLLGRRVPDLELMVEGEPLRLFTLLHEARPVVLDLGEAGDALDVSAPWGGPVRLTRARYEGSWELPVIGTVPAPAALLIRPDGYVAWVGDGSAAGLTDALTGWFGAPAPAAGSGPEPASRGAPR